MEGKYGWQTLKPLLQPLDTKRGNGMRTQMMMKMTGNLTTSEPLRHNLAVSSKLDDDGGIKNAGRTSKIGRNTTSLASMISKTTYLMNLTTKLLPLLLRIMSLSLQLLLCKIDRIKGRSQWIPGLVLNEITPTPTNHRISKPPMQLKIPLSPQSLPIQIELTETNHRLQFGWIGQHNNNRGTIDPTPRKIILMPLIWRIND